MGATFSWSPEGRSPRDLQRRISTRPLSLKRVLRRVVVEPPARDVLARPGAAVPADRAMPEDALERLDRKQEVFALLVARESPHLGPAPAVAEQLMVPLAHPVRDRRVELERDGRRGNGYPHTGLVED